MPPFAPEGIAYPGIAVLGPPADPAPPCWVRPQPIFQSVARDRTVWEDLLEGRLGILGSRMTAAPDPGWDPAGSAGRPLRDPGFRLFGNGVRTGDPGHPQAYRAHRARGSGARGNPEATSIRAIARVTA
jgi:hypothetical protein